MVDDLAGRRCLITGASSGIGAAVAERFGALGAHVAIHCNDNREGADAVADAIRARGGKVVVLQAKLDALNATADTGNKIAAQASVDEGKKLDTIATNTGRIGTVSSAALAAPR